MYELTCLNLDNNKTFKKVFYNVIAKDYFIKKCKYSKRIRVLGTVYIKY